MLTERKSNRRLVFNMLVSSDKGISWREIEADIYGLALIPSGYIHPQLKRDDLVMVENSVFDLSVPENVIYLFLEHIQGNCKVLTC